MLVKEIFWKSLQITTAQILDEFSKILDLAIIQFVNSTPEAFSKPQKLIARYAWTGFSFCHVNVAVAWRLETNCSTPIDKKEKRNEDKEGSKWDSWKERKKKRKKELYESGRQKRRKEKERSKKLMKKELGPSSLLLKPFGVSVWRRYIHSSLWVSLIAEVLSRAFFCEKGRFFLWRWLFERECDSTSIDLLKSIALILETGRQMLSKKNFFFLLHSLSSFICVSKQQGN